MKKLNEFFLIIFLVIATAFMLFACGKSEKGHSHSLSHIERVGPDCSHSGVIEHYACYDCNQKFSDAGGEYPISEVTLPASHTGGTEIRGATLPTEDSSGNTGDTYCLGCGELIAEGEVIPKLAHTHSIVKTEAKAPSCKIGGNIEHYACTGCGKKYSDAEAKNEITEVEIPPSHIGGTELQSQKAATEYQEGYTGDLCCLGCGDVLMGGSTVPKLDHTHAMIKFEAVAPICNAHGNIEYYLCGVCERKYSDVEGNAELSDVTLPPSHSGGTELRDQIAPTEEREGYTGDLYCCGCGELLEYGSAVSRLDHAHTMIKHEAKAPTCKTGGNKEYYRCDVCESTYADEEGITVLSDVALPPSHTGGTAICNRKAATEESEGYTGDLCCLGCGDVLEYGTSLPRLDHSHSIIKVEAIAPSCNRDGNIEYYLCTLCDGMYADAYAINEIFAVRLPSAHTGGTEIRGEYSPTESEEGYTGDVYCLRCGEMLISGSPIERVPHKHTLAKTDYANPTCTASGNIEYYTCASCEKIFADELLTAEIKLSDTAISPLGHTASHVEAKEATCMDFGNPEYWHCTVCEENYADAEGRAAISALVLPRLDHKLTYYKAVDPTCTTDGSVAYYYCSLCKLCYTNENADTPLLNTTVPASHALIYCAAASASCTDYGNIEYWHCAECGSDYADEAAAYALQSVVIEMTEHVFIGEVCTVCGFSRNARLIYELTNEEYTVVGLSDIGGGSVVIPDSYNGLSVTAIADGAFSGNTDIVSLSVGDGVRNIGASAFNGCTNLRSVSFGASVESIGADAFSDCKNMRGLELPPKLRVIGEYAFKSCASVTSVVLREKIVSIGAGAFLDCGGLLSVTLSKGIDMLSYETFYNCNKLVEVINHSSLSLMESSNEHGFVAYYAKEVHGGTSKIINVDGFLFYTYGGVNYLLGYDGDSSALILPESYNGEKYEIYRYAFMGTDVTEITVSSGVTLVGDNAFRECSLLEKISLGDSVERIGASAFKNCTALTGLVIPDSVKNVDSYAFYGCAAIESVTLGAGLNKISTYAFEKCARLGLVINNSSLNLTVGSASNGYVAYYAKEIREAD